MTDETLVLELARGGMGANYWIMGHADHGWWGLVKDALVVQGVARDVPPGPIEDEIRAASEVMAGQGPDIEERHVDVSPKRLDEVEQEGARILMAMAPTLTGLPDDAAAQARTWLYTFAERTANTSRDEFRGPRTSAEEARALVALRDFLDDPEANPLTH